MSVQPLTVTTALERTAAQHQSLLCFWLKRPGSIWRPTRVRKQVLPLITSEEPCFGVSNSTSRRG
jgi:hypothetical protein